MAAVAEPLPALRAVIEHPDLIQPGQREQQRGEHESGDEESLLHGASLDEAACCVSTACPRLMGGPQVDRAGVGAGPARRYPGVRRLLSSLPVLGCSVERTRLEGSVPKMAC